jgi:tRNA threonylcarbamoyladenosine biosynthesis protein TsaB
MLVLIIRTDKPEAEIGLFNETEKLSYITWQAHRQLAETIHLKIKQLLEDSSKTLKDLEAIAVFKGPGSFTGLRIGLSVANAFAAGLQIPIVGTSGENWITDGLSRLQSDENEEIVLPEYGAPVKTTKPRK